MALSPLEAWTIFRADKLQHIEGKAALDALEKEDFEAYETHAEKFEMDLAKLGIEAQNESAKVWGDNPAVLAELEASNAWDWTADTYIKAVSVFKGTRYEKLHLAAMFHVNPNELLLGLVKP